MTKRLAFLGFGTIARDVAAGLRPRLDVKLAALCRRGDAPLDADVHRLADLDDLVAWAPDLVVEAASQEAVQDHAQRCLQAGVPVVVTSVGALVDEPFRLRLLDAARAGKTRLIVPSGAVASLDYLRAVQQAGGATVTYESRKPAAAWRDELTRLGHDPDALERPVVLYEGDAATAAKTYPKNLNVAATLALGGVGMQATRVRVVADPAATGNLHRIRVEGPLGTLTTELANQPSPGNPKTSWIVAQSVVATVLRQFDGFQVG